MAGDLAQDLVSDGSRHGFRNSNFNCLRTHIVDAQMHLQARYDKGLPNPIHVTHLNELCNM